MPPTPPAHSRSSSSSQSVIPCSPTCIASPEESLENVIAHGTPTTPPNQQSPPTPDRTPPGRGIATRPPPRAGMLQRLHTRTDETSRSESHATGTEYPPSEDSKSERSTFHPAPPSSRTSQSTCRRVSDRTAEAVVGLCLGLEFSQEEDSDVTPKTKAEQFLFLDSKWRPGEIAAEWDGSASNHGNSKRQWPPPAPLTPGEFKIGKTEVLEDVTVSPSNATKAVRNMSLVDKSFSEPSPKPIKNKTEEDGFWTLPAAFQPSVSNDMHNKRVSALSNKSTVSTIVEAILVDGPAQPSKTLRHMKKNKTLRDSSSDVAACSVRSSAQTQSSEEQGTPTRPSKPSQDRRHDSIASNKTSSSISSNRAMREVWRSGGVPVAIIPERRSSVKSNRPPSLRSTSSRRCKRSRSVGPVPLSSLSASKDLTPFFERPSRRRQAQVSESDNSDGQHTIDYPPAVPVRTSSLSAATSRNASRSTSRAGSRACSRADSLNYPEYLENSMDEKHDGAEKEREKGVPEVRLQRAATLELLQQPGEENGHDPDNHHLNVDNNGDSLFGSRQSIHKTPFSQTSGETNGTSAPEVSEATAVNIYAHQNSSVLMVNHSTKPSESSDESANTGSHLASRCAVKKMEPGNATTRPQRALPIGTGDTDSPLRNPRAPPEPPVLHDPPALAFIPATPSGMTPTAEKQKMLGNFYDALEEKPRKPLLERRACSRRHSDSDNWELLRGRRLLVDGYGGGGLLSRAFSLSRNSRGSRSEKINSVRNKAKEPAIEADDYPNSEKPPPDETKLHPFWKPQYSDSNGETGWDSDMFYGEDDMYYRYPIIDNRPRPRRRSLSFRLKRTFAILPTAPERGHSVSSYGGNSRDRRTIQRTPSGNLRVIKNRRSFDNACHDLSCERSDQIQPYTVPIRTSSSPARGHSLRHKGRLFLVSQDSGDGAMKKPRSPSQHYRGQPRRSSSKLREVLNDYGLRTLPRRLSEKRREKRSRELRGKISAPREVRDGVGDVIKRRDLRVGFSGAVPHV